jgi:hypothetical protein
MKKLVLFSLVILLFSCSTESVVQKDGIKILAASKESQFLSTFSTSLGIDTISMISNSSTIKIYGISGKKRNVNNINVNLDGAKFTIETGGSEYKLILELNEQYNNRKLIYSLDKLTKVITNLTNQEKLLVQNSNLNNLEETKLLTVLTLFNEVRSSDSQTLTADVKKSISTREAKSQSCDRTIMSVRSTRSSAISNATTATNTFIKAHPDCHTVYGVDSGCIFEDYGCVATQSVSCSGGGCDVSYGEL